MPGIWTCAAACAMPVCLTAPIVGAILAYTYTPEAFLEGFVVMSAQVAFGEAVVLMVIGLPLMRNLPKLRFFREFIASL